MKTEYCDPLERILKKARKDAIQDKSPCVGTRAVLIGLLSEKCEARTILKSLGVTMKKLLAVDGKAK